MKTIYSILVTILMISFVSCSNNDFIEDEFISDIDTPVAVTVSYNLSAKSIYSSSMTRSSSYTDLGDSIWTNVFKPAIENGILADSTMNITFKNLKDGLTTTVHTKYGTPIIIKKGRYAVSGTIGQYGGGSPQYIMQFGSLELCDTITINEQNSNISIKAKVEYQSLIISNSKFTANAEGYYGTSSYNYNGYWYCFVDTYDVHLSSSKNDYYEYTFAFDDIIYYKFKPVHNNFYYYGQSTNTTTYDVDMNNGHK